MNAWFDNSEDVIAAEAAHMARVFARQGAVWSRGEGCRLWDKNGRAHLDFFSGHAVMALGYGHPRQRDAMLRQLENLVHTGNLYYSEAQVELARRLTAASFGDKVFFANSGAEITELAIKLARKGAARRGGHAGAYEIITIQGSFHGRTYGALSATGQEKYHAGLGPMLPGFKYVPRGNFVAAAAAITNRTCALLVEPVQGEGGVHPAEAEYLRQVRKLCDRNRLLLIFDEIQCGLGRIGTHHAYEHYGVEPDVLLLGKPLGGGLPLSALVTTGETARDLGPGDHGSTFGGNPVAAAGGVVLLESLAQPGFLAHVRETGDKLAEGLDGLHRRFRGLIRQRRGLGLMQALELEDHGPEAVRLALEEGLVINCTAGHTLRFLPALIVGRAEVDEALDIMDRVFARLAEKEK